MKLQFLDQVTEMKTEISYEKIVEEITNLLSDDYYYQHIIVNSTLIVEDIEELFIKSNLEINYIEVIAVPAREFINELLLSAEEYLHRVIPELPSLSEKLYNNSSASGWNELNQLFEGIQWIASMVSTVKQSKYCPHYWLSLEKLVTKFQSDLFIMEEAMCNKDVILIADIVQYEIQPVFEELIVKIRENIDLVENQN